MNKSIYRLMLTVLMCMVGVISASATTFISDIKLGIHDSSESTAKGYLTNNSYTVIDVELNNNTNKGGEAWVFLGYKTTTDASKAITGIMIVSGKSYLSGHIEGTDSYITFTGDSRKWYRCPYEGSSADINRENGGDYLTIYYTRDNCVANGGSPLTGLNAKTVTGLAGWTYAKMWKDGSITDNGNTNNGTSGVKTYITYSTHTHNFTYYSISNYRHNYGCKVCGYAESSDTHGTMYYDNGDGKTHTYGCVQCDYKVTGDHAMNYTDNGDGTHTSRCYQCYYSVKAAHQLTYTDNGDGTHTSNCSICSHTESAAHTQTYTDNGDGTHTGNCSICSHTETASHTLACSMHDEETHSNQCTFCSYDENQLANHTFQVTKKANGTFAFSCPACSYTGIASYIYGDINLDGKVDITDVAQLINVLKGGANVTPRCNANPKVDYEVNLSDLDQLKDIIFNHGILHFHLYNEPTEGTIDTGGDNSGDDVPKTADVKARR